MIIWGVINRFGQSCAEERETVENVVATLQEGGHETLLCEGDKGLLNPREVHATRSASPSLRNRLQHGLRDSARVPLHPHPGDARDGRRPVHRIEPARAWGSG